MNVFTESYLRGNIVAWLPIQKKDSVCYIGDGRDVVAGRLRELSDCVACVPGEDEIPSGSRFDYIISLCYVSGKGMQTCFDHLKETGAFILAAENAYGLKYFAGAKEVGSMKYFGAVEAVEGSVAYTGEELEEALEAAGFASQQFYYPFPDCYFAMSIYSDDYLPKQGELIDQIGNFEAERLVLFDESRAFDALVTRGKFREFSNSYLVVAGKKDFQGMINERGEQISFVKFSNDRGEAHNIRTLITKSKDGAFHLLKMADSEKSLPHIEHMKKTYQALLELYADAGFEINAYTEREYGAEFEFLSGYTMEEALDQYIKQGEYEKAVEKMFAVFDEIRACKNKKEFQATQEFQEVFGAQELPVGLLAADVCDIDLIMPNILVGEDGKWTVIDYEWSFHFPAPLNFIVYRNIRYYADTTAARRALNPQSLYKRAGISGQELAAYEKMEEAFQSYVLNGHTPMRQRYKESGKPAYHVSSVLHVIDELERRRALQIYFDRGSGFCEADVRTYHSKALDGTYHLEIPVKDSVRQVRIDPGSQACTVQIDRLAWKGRNDGMLPFLCNGHKMSGNTYLFDTDDPNILLEQLPAGEKTLQIDMRIDSMNLAAAEWIALKIDAKYRLKKILKK